MNIKNLKCMALALMLFAIQASGQDNREISTKNDDVRIAGKSEKMSEKDPADEDVKYYVLITEGRRERRLLPQYFSAGMTSVKWIFPVPASNSIGTIDKQSNGIVFIKFIDEGTGPEVTPVATDYGKKAYCLFDYRFCPNYTDDMIVYSQNLVAIIANIKTGEAFYANCGLSAPTEDLILGIHFLDPRKNLFVIVKSIFDRDFDGWNDYLYVVKLEGQQLVDVGWNVHIGKTSYILRGVPLYNAWFVHDRKLFAYDNGRILCTDGSRPVSHPFSEVFNANSDRIGNIRDVAIHPTLPFGIMIEDYSSDSIVHRLKAVCWKAKKPKQRIVAFSDIFRHLAPFFGSKRMALAYQSFSPDGNWYVVGFLTSEAAAVRHKFQAPFFIAIPIDSRRPNFLVVEDIIILGQVENMTSLAWTTDPVSFVVSNGEALHKWDLAELPAARVFVDR